MNILHVLDERWDSGLTAYGLGAARALRDRGHAVWIAAHPDGPADRAARAEGFSTLVPSVRGLRRAVIQHRIEVLNAHTGSGHSRGFLATRGTPAALVRTRAEARRLAPRPGQGFLFRRTDAVIAASRALGEAYAAAYPFLRERTRVVFPGVALSPATAEPPAPLRTAVVGRLDPVKGHAYFLEAVERLRDRGPVDEFWIVGEDKNLTRAELEKEAGRRGVADRVRFAGRLPDVAAFMRSCHLGVVSSIGSEAVSRVALEWLALGRPIVATRVGALPELVEDGKNGRLVPPRDGAALAAALGALLDDGEARRRMGAEARRRVEHQFSVPRWGEETEAAYRRAVDHRRRPA